MGMKWPDIRTDVLLKFSAEGSCSEGIVRERIARGRFSGGGMFVTMFLGDFRGSEGMTAGIIQGKCPRGLQGKMIIFIHLHQNGRNT